jgi:hypothetical protein
VLSALVLGAVLVGSVFVAASPPQPTVAAKTITAIRRAKIFLVFLIYQFLLIKIKFYYPIPEKTIFSGRNLFYLKNYLIF